MSDEPIRHDEHDEPQDEVDAHAVKAKANEEPESEDDGEVEGHIQNFKYK